MKSMNAININTLVKKDINGNYYLLEKLPKGKVIIGKIDELHIIHYYDNLDLSNISCRKLVYRNQKQKLITKMPTCLVKLEFNDCQFDLISSYESRNGFPDTIREIIFFNSTIKSLPHFPTSLEKLTFFKSTILDIPFFCESLKEIDIVSSTLGPLSEFPMDLEFLRIVNSNIKDLHLMNYLPFTLRKLIFYGNTTPIKFLRGLDNIELEFHQYEEVELIDIKPNVFIKGDTNIFVKDDGCLIRNQNDYNEFLHYRNFEC